MWLSFLTQEVQSYASISHVLFNEVDVGFPEFIVTVRDQLETSVIVRVPLKELVSPVLQNINEMYSVLKTNFKLNKLAFYVGPIMFS